MDPEDCRANARECYDMAPKIADPEARRELLYLMAQWHELADRITKDRRKLH
jgi:hypothetical protein